MEHYATSECQDIRNLAELFCSISGTVSSCHSQTSAFMHCYFVAVNLAIVRPPAKVKQFYRKSLFALPAPPALIRGNQLSIPAPHSQAGIQPPHYLPKQRKQPAYPPRTSCQLLVWGSIKRDTGGSVSGVRVVSDRLRSGDAPTA